MDLPNTSPQVVSSAPYAQWRADGMKIVEDLFPVTPAITWDLLLALRQSLRQGTDWEQTLDLFLACRRVMEASHYLPFYRLRRILAGSLRLAARDNPTGMQSLEEVLRKNHRSLADLKRAVCRDHFEQNLEASTSLELRIVESAA